MFVFLGIKKVLEDKLGDPGFFDEEAAKGNLNHGFLFILKRLHWPMYLEGFFVPGIMLRAPAHKMTQTHSADLRAALMGPISQNSCCHPTYLKPLLQSLIAS